MTELFRPNTLLSLPHAPPPTNAPAVMRHRVCEVWALLLHGWRHFCVFLDDIKNPTVIFDCNAFVASKARAIAQTGANLCVPLEEEY